ncbi:hypothetical protein BDAP_000119 [Binucleata daphniae]
MISLDKNLLNVIVAYTKNERAIGKNMSIPWERLTADLRLINYLTTQPNTAVIMGSKTFESIYKAIGKPLPNRINVVLTRQENITKLIETFEKKEESEINSEQKTNSDKTYSNISDCYTFKTLDDATSYCKSKNLNIVIFGGYKAYEEALKHKCKLFCTEIEGKDFMCDAFFPKCNVKLLNVSGEVQKLMIEKNVKQTWEYENETFVENGLKYKFMVGYN